MNTSAPRFTPRSRLDLVGTGYSGILPASPLSSHPLYIYTGVMSTRYTGLVTTEVSLCAF
jgi:hypothetical protein